MKTTSRRRVLVSSVSMLLVATLALGTATFAWFTNNTRVTADGMKVQAGASVGLQITGNNGGAWGPTYTFNKDSKTTTATLQPVSVDYTASNAYANLGTPYLPEEAKVDGPWTAEKTANFLNWKEAAYPTNVNEATTGDAYGFNEYFAVYEVGIKSTTGPINEDVYMKLRYNGDKEDFIRVAVLEQAGATQDYDGDSIINVYGHDEGANAIYQIKNAQGDADVKSEAQKLVGSDTDDTDGVKIADKGEITTSAKYYTILVWFEGQDAQCTDNNQQAIGTINIEYYYTPSSN